MMNLDVYLLYMMYSCRRRVTKKVVPYMEMPLIFYKKKKKKKKKKCLIIEERNINLVILLVKML